MANILLIEPNYKNKYPPLGLMKISTYHKIIGDNVYFCKGENNNLKDKLWDRIYITTLFTFYFDKTIDIIEYYKNSVSHISKIYCGGVLATVAHKKLLEKFNVTIISGLINKPNVLGNDNIIVDNLPPDYSIIDREHNPFFNYNYHINNAYITYATRGCIRRCPFCAVPIIEPNFEHYIDIKEHIQYIKNNFGEKKDLMLLDNNVLASRHFERIIEDIKESGFYRDAYFCYKKNGRNQRKKRYVDFNQGIDARLLTDEKCKKLSEIAIKPLRIAFDDTSNESINLYKEKSILAANHGIKHLSNYILFNFLDKPEDLYKRLKVVTSLNEYFKRNNFETRIWSFPMKYSPIYGENAFDRKYIGVNWTEKQVRAIQCILNATHGLVGPKKEFFNIAFGRNLKEFKKILLMPENIIINRKLYENNGITKKWEKHYEKLNKNSSLYKYIISNKSFSNTPKSLQDKPIMKFYMNKFVA
ncbi:MAG: hypothetical protein VB048_01255 [Bacteroidaceae bacterium]|nr:hypothetical protein [Bacteroidaceae bacterium]